jgi:hypothetical protein
VRAQVLLSLYTDFENFKTFRPGQQRDKELHTMLEQVVAWGGALKSLRSEATREAAVAGE